MKKTKLLMPILGATALMGAVTPIVACKIGPTKSEVSVYNSGAKTQDIKVTLSNDKAVVGKKFVTTLSWELPAESSGAYYVNSATVIIGSKAIGEYVEEIYEDGFKLSNHTMTSVDLEVPANQITDDSKIIIVIDLELSEFSKAIQINTYDDQYVQVTYWGTVTSYDVLRSSGNIENPSEEEFEEVEGGESVQLQFDLSKWTGSFKDEDPLYAIMGYWNGSNFQVLSPSMDDCGYAWYGESGLPLTCKQDQGIAAFEILAPKGGWGKEQENRKSIFLHYKFQQSHSNYFQIMIGQPHTQE